MLVKTQSTPFAALVSPVEKVFAFQLISIPINGNQRRKNKLSKGINNDRYIDSYQLSTVKGKVFCAFTVRTVKALTQFVSDFIGPLNLHSKIITKLQVNTDNACAMGDQYCFIT